MGYAACVSRRALRVLAITRIFPNKVEPHSAPFNRQQFAALGHMADVRVMATIPWFPGSRFVKKSKTWSLRTVPAHDTIDGLDVHHPRIPYVPGLPGVSGVLEAASLLPAIRKQRFDVILGSWAHPEGTAAVALAKLLRVPAVVKAHGSDLNVQGNMLGPRTNLAWALPRAARVVTVSAALGERAVQLGARPESIAVVPNGTDASLFFVRDRDEARAALDWPGPWPERLIVYVGRLERAKGVLDLIDAFLRIADRDPGLSLALVGDGGALTEAKARAAPLGSRVQFLGARPLAQIPLWMSASTLVTLPSHAEGSPNVVREALACGRPVVGSEVGGIPELLTSRDLGATVPARDPQALGEALLEVSGRSFDAAVIRSASGGSWEDSASCLLRVLEDVTGIADGQG